MTRLSSAEAKRLVAELNDIKQTSLKIQLKCFELVRKYCQHPSDEADFDLDVDNEGEAFLECRRCTSCGKILTEGLE
jgi:hypothetical protein